MIIDRIDTYKSSRRQCVSPSQWVHTRNINNLWQVITKVKLLELPIVVERNQMQVDVFTCTSS